MQNSWEPAAKSCLCDVEVGKGKGGLYIKKWAHSCPFNTQYSHYLCGDAVGQLLITASYQHASPKYRRVLYCCAHDGHGSWFVSWTESSLWNNRTSERNCLIFCFLQQGDPYPWIKVSSYAPSDWAAQLHSKKVPSPFDSVWLLLSERQTEGERGNREDRDMEKDRQKKGKCCLTGQASESTAGGCRQLGIPF